MFTELPSGTIFNTGSTEASTKVLVGQKMIAGETIIADFTKSSKPVTRNIDEK